MAKRFDDGMGIAAHRGHPTATPAKAHRNCTKPDRLSPVRRAYRSMGEVHLADIGRLVTCWRSALIAAKVMRGDRIGLLLPNGLDWVCSDQVALALGAVVVPLYATDSPRNWAYKLDHADVRLVVLNHVDQ